MKKRINITAIILLLVIALTSAFSCKKTTSTRKPSDDVNKPTAVEWTDSYLVKNGVGNYTAVLPDNADARAQKAYDELAEFFTRATGSIIDLKTESEVSYSDGAKLIILGKCERLWQAAGFAPDTDELGLNGFILKTVGDNMFVAGGTQYGTLFGVYEFLRYEFGYEAYSTSCVKIDTGVRDKRLAKLDVTKIPDIQQLQSHFGNLADDAEGAIRMGFESTEDVWILVKGSNVHNFYSYVSPDDWPDNPEWFLNDQLCLSNEDMYQRAFLPALKEAIRSNPSLSNISITQRDKDRWCNCDDCLAEHKKYGTDAGVMIKFMNKASADINEWMKTEFPGRKMTFIFFAYHSTTTNPPVKYNEKTQKYEAIDDEVICADDVAVYFAPIYADFTKSLYDETNRAFLVAAEGWKAICKTMFVWAYETNFSQYLVPYNTFNSMQGNYKFFKEYNVAMLFNQGQVNNGNSTAFNNLKIWLDSKLRWDVNADYEALIDEFFDNYFGAASASMKKYFDDLRVWFNHQENYLGISGSIYANTQTRKFWPKGVLDGFLRSIEQAEADIAPLEKSDPYAYSAIHDRIALESISVRYLLFKIYSSDYSETETYELKKGLKSDLIRLGVSRLTEKTTIDNLYSGWDV